jgi:hypothetical protein
VNDARDLVRELFPQARWAVVGGSVVTPARTAGSDLDIVVFLPDDDPASPARDTRRFRGWPVELFIHDRKTLDHYLDKDLARRQPALQRMLAVGCRCWAPTRTSTRSRPAAARSWRRVLVRWVLMSWPPRATG